VAVYHPALHQGKGRVAEHAVGFVDPPEPVIDETGVRPLMKAF
jgi:hypothetical protein